MKRIIAEWPQAPRTRDARNAALVCAGVFTFMTVAQLFSFEKFIPLLDSFDLPVGISGQAIAILLAVCSVLALPFLLQMKLSIAMRWFSMGAGWVIPVAWVFLAVWANLSTDQIDNIGFLGASVSIIPGWWAVCVPLGLGILVAWASWGQWPARRSKS